jgi:tripeptide aminopeptidase
MVDRGRVIEEFLELVQIGSVSRREAGMARRLVPALKAMGAEVEVDEAGAAVGGDSGNVLARFRGTAPDAPPLLVSAHMDTVIPGDNVRPVVQGDVVRTDGTTVLGGDDKTGIVAILEALRVARERRIPHGTVEVLFTICEEVGLLGAKHFDGRRLTARTGIVLDCDGVCELITRAPAANRIVVSVHGVEAHAGIAPEEGISAIQVAAQAIAGMRLGRVDAETTANLGLIQGGLATNIIPNRVDIRGETRSLSVERLEEQSAHMVERFQTVVAATPGVTVNGRERRARVESEVTRVYERLDIADGAPIVRMIAEAARRLNRPFRTRSTGGGSDANVFTARGLEIANLGCGMREIHTVNEWVNVNDIVSTAELLVETLRVNAERSIR